MIPRAPDRLVLRWLARRGEDTASTIGAVYRMSLVDVITLEGQRLVASRLDVTTTPPRRLFYATAEGRGAAGVGDALRKVGT